MNDCHESPSIHEHIAAVLGELGFQDCTCHRTGILLCNGYCQGRQFWYAEARVVWRLEESRLEFYNLEGQLLRELSLAPPNACAAA